MTTTANLTGSEKNLLRLLNVPASATVTRRSDQEFDLSIEGMLPSRGAFTGKNVKYVEESKGHTRVTGLGKWDPNGVSVTNTSAWLPLFLLRQFYQRDGYAEDIEQEITNCYVGDWSFVRDGDTERIWSCFNDYARILSEMTDERRKKFALPDMPA